MCSKVKTEITHESSSGMAHKKAVFTAKFLLKVELSPFCSYSVASFFNLLMFEKEVYLLFRYELLLAIDACYFRKVLEINI